MFYVATKDVLRIKAGAIITKDPNKQSWLCYNPGADCFAINGEESMLCAGCGILRTLNGSFWENIGKYNTLSKYVKIYSVSEENVHFISYHKDKKENSTTTGWSISALLRQYNYWNGE